MRDVILITYRPHAWWVNSFVPRPFYARGGNRRERDKGLVPVVRVCVEFYQDSSKIVFFGIFWYTDLI